MSLKFNQRTSLWLSRHVEVLDDHTVVMRTVRLGTVSEVRSHLADLRPQAIHISNKAPKLLTVSVIACLAASGLVLGAMRSASIERGSLLILGAVVCGVIGLITLEMYLRRRANYILFFSETTNRPFIVLHPTKPDRASIDRFVTNLVTLIDRARHLRLAANAPVQTMSVLH